MTWSFPLPLPLKAWKSQHIPNTDSCFFYSALCYISLPANFHRRHPSHHRLLCAPRQLLCSQPRVRNWQSIKPSCCWPGETNYKSVFVFKQRYHWIWNVRWPHDLMCGGVVLKICVHIHAMHFSCGPSSTNLVFVALLYRLLKLIIGKNSAHDFPFLDQLLVVTLPESGYFRCVALIKDATLSKIAEKQCCQTRASCGQQGSWTSCRHWKALLVLGCLCRRGNIFQCGNSTSNYQNISLELQQKKNHYCFLSCSQKKKNCFGGSEFLLDVPW